MKYLAFSTFLIAAPLACQAQGNQVEHRRYAVPTTEMDWEECAYEYTPQCPPTVSIEQAACEAPLVVNGRVLQAVNGQTRLDTVVQIQVDYRSEFFGSVDRQTVQKWGAGLDNTAEDSIFTGNSGFFTTWITGFNNTPTDLAPAGAGTTPCGTRAPRSQETLFFFLQGLPENEGKKVEFQEDGTSLNVNFTLSTSALQSGHVDDNTDTFAMVSAGAFGDSNLLEGEGNCEAVYCCYNPDCDRCAGVLEAVKDKFRCSSTFALTTDGSSSLLLSPFVWALGLLSATAVLF